MDQTRKPRDLGAELAWMIRELVRQIVADQDAVVVTGTAEAAGSIIIDVQVAPADVGRVIGKGGITARSMRVLLDAAATKNRVRCQLNILREDR